MPIHITIDRGVDWLAKKTLDYRDAQMPEARRAQLAPVTKYNLLVSGFNTSTLLLIAAVASAVLFAYTAAFVLGAIAIFTRLTTERELHTYAIPPVNQEEPGHLAQLARVAMNVLGMDRRNLGNAILQRLGAGDVENWEENEIVFDVYPIWKNKAPIPADPNRQPVRDAAPRGEAPAAVAPVAG
jgi:hypothetical protein